MSLFLTVQQDYVAALKAKEIIKKDILNYLFAQLKNKKIELHRELKDDEVIQIIKKEIKMRQETISYAKQAGKDDEVSLEGEKIDVLETYLPKQLNEDELKELVQQKINELTITDLQKQKGQLIGIMMKEYGPQIDGSILQKVINSL
ncbi:MAG: GatB/YqeY domain-containing protein [bacterium]|nr:GatB/YqeY domain-containing protein [bacterium]